MTLWIEDAGVPAFAAEVPPLHPIVAVARSLGGSRWGIVAAVLIALALGAVLHAVLRGRDRRFRLAAAAIAAATSLVLPLPIALFLLGAVSTGVALHRLQSDPSRGRFALGLVIASAAIVGTGAPLLRWLALAALTGLVAAAVSKRGMHAGTWAGAAAVVAAIGLTTWWWLPALHVGGRTDLRARLTASGVTPLTFAERYALPGESAPKLPSRSFVHLDHIPAKIARTSGAERPEVVRRIGTPAASERGTLAVRVSDAPAWGLIAFGEPAWPGWRVYWNGERLPPVIVNGGTAGSFVPPGPGLLELRYRPDAFDMGLRYAGLAALLSLLTLAWPWYRRLPSFRPRESFSIVWRECARLAPRFSRASPLLLLGGVVLYGAFLTSHRVTSAGGADTSGYLNEARLWLRGELVVPVAPPSGLRLPPAMASRFVPLGFVPGSEEGTMVPTYPPGLPLHYAVAARIGGEGAFWLVTPIVSAVGILLMVLLARELGFGWWAAGAAAAILALFPTFVMFGVLPMSDSVATTWALAAMLFAFRGRRQWGWAAAAGAALGIGVLVRPTQVFLLPALLTVLGLRWRALTAFLSAGAPFAAAQMAIASQLWGSAVRTGYGSIEPLLAWGNVPVRFGHYVSWLARLLSPLVFPLGLWGIAVPAAERSVRIALALWFVPFFAFYCFYQPYELWWYTRFLSPAVPPLILLALFAARWLLARFPPAWARLLALALLGAVLATEVMQIRIRGPHRLASEERVYPEAIAMAAAHVPPGGLVLGMQLSGAYLFYRGETMLRYDFVSEEESSLVRARAAAEDQPVHALVMDWEIPELRARFPAPWAPVAEVRNVTLFELMPPR
ncbi:MAG TPA: glycosyltransferase family 39 protein [Thermoanaerobaculia bacterium]|nr:glycosyltransferase family 39 protein [Thermoanaerobaculia bacterium]